MTLQLAAEMKSLISDAEFLLLGWAHTCNITAYRESADKLVAA